VLHPSAALVPLAKQCVAGNQAACRIRQARQTRITRRATTDLVRAASVYCRDQQTAGGPAATRLALRARVIRPPDWAHRNDPAATRSDDYALGIFPVAKVSAPVIYAAR
jgi:hypothetical protein